MIMISNPSALAKGLKRGTVGRVPILLCGDSNVYTFGGFQQGTPEAIRSIGGGLYASSVAPCGGGLAQGGTQNSPSAGTADNFTSLVGPGGIGGGTADATRKAVFDFFSAHYADAVPSGPNTNSGPITIPVPFGGINLQTAMNLHVWGVSFAAGGSMLLQYRIQGGATNYGASMTLSAVGPDARLHKTFSIAADATRSAVTNHEIMYNYTATGTGPMYWTSIALEVPAISSGFQVNTFLAEGGRDTGNILDIYNICRVSGLEKIQQIRDLAGNDTTCIVIIQEGLNDRNNGTDAAYVQNSKIVSATSTTTTVSGIVGSSNDLVGQLLTHGYTFTDHSTLTETKTITSWNPATQQFGHAAWTTTPNAGEWSRISPAAITVQTRQGYYTNTKQLISMLRTDLTSKGLTPVFLVIPAWQDASPPNNIYLSQYYDAAAQLALENSDVTAVRTDQLMTYDQMYAWNQQNTTHIGGHSIASLLRKIFLYCLAAA